MDNKSVKDDGDDAVTELNEAEDLVTEPNAEAATDPDNEATQVFDLGTDEVTKIDSDESIDDDDDLTVFDTLANQVTSPDQDDSDQTITQPFDTSMLPNRDDSTLGDATTPLDSDDDQTQAYVPDAHIPEQLSSDPTILEDLSQRESSGTDKTIGDGSLSMESEVMTVHESVTKPTSSSQPEPMFQVKLFTIGQRLQNYTVIREIARGGMGVVYLARDEIYNREVALKTLSSDSSESLDLFKREFRSLADMVHPNIATLYELVSDGGSWFFTMELLDGVDFSRYTRLGFESEEIEPTICPTTGKTEAKRFSRLRKALDQLVRGLWALHKTGMIHRDIKPSNVMVTRSGQVKLVDFGLVADSAAVASGKKKTIEGTIPYMAPEQASGGGSSEASDWYAVGVMIYEILTGHQPFEGKGLEVLVRKRDNDAPHPSTQVSGLPEDLCSLCMQLLDRDPAKRPTSDEMLELLNIEDAQPVAGSTLSEGAANVSFVGRRKHMDRLQEIFVDVRQGNGQMVLVHGPSGFGKSALVNHFLQNLGNLDSTVVLNGRCYERESVPYKAWDSLIDSLASSLKSMNRKERSPLLPKDAAPLVHLFPVLGTVTQLREARESSELPSDQQELRRQAFRALRELLSLYGQHKTLVLYIDDLQWGDEDSAALLVELLKPPQIPKLLLLGTYRREDEVSSRFLGVLREFCQQIDEPPTWQDIAVNPLTRNESIELVLKVFDRTDANCVAIAKRIADEAGGNPFFIRELTRMGQSAGSDIQKSESPDSQSGIGRTSVQLDEVLWQHISQLSEETRRLLEVVAVSGKPIEMRHAFATAAVSDRGPVLETELRAESLIRVSDTDDGGLISCYHDRIRETIVAHIGDDVRRDHHLEIARETEVAYKIDGRRYADQMTGAAEDVTLGHSVPSIDAPEEIVPDIVFDLAFHFDAAGDSASALPYALAAAEQAQQQYSLEVAKQQYQIAERGVAEDQVDVRFRIAQGLGQVQLLRGEYEEARHCFETARELADDDEIQASMDVKIGEIFFKCGDMQNAARILERAARAIRQPLPDNVLKMIYLTSRESIIQMFHTMLPKVFLDRLDMQTAGSERLAMHIYSQLTHVYWFARGQIACMYVHLREMNLAEKYSASLELAQAYSEHAPVMATVPLFQRGIKYARRSHEIREHFGHLWGQGQSYSFWALCTYSASQLHETIELEDKAIPIFEQTGDWWEANMARFQRGLAHYRLGDLDAAIEDSYRVHRSGLELGDAQASGITLHTWAMASQGNIPAEVLATEIERPRHDFQVITQVFMAEAVRLIYNSEPETAIEVLIEANRVVKRHGLRSAYDAPAMPWLSTAIRHAMDKDSNNRSRLLRRLKRAVRKSLWITWLFRLDYPHALRESGELAMLTGKLSKAEKQFLKSIAVADEIGSRYEAAQSQVRLCECRKQMGQSNEAEIEAAHEKLQSILPQTCPAR